MSSFAVHAVGLGKQYRVGQLESGYETLREQLSSLGRRAVGHGGARRQQELFWALRDVSFEIALGEVVGIIGRNGAGKTTMLKILSRITEPTEGYVDVRGRLGSLLEVGTGFHTELTGRENVFLNGAVLGMRRRDVIERFDEIVEFAGVEKFIDTPVKRYSSGMFVRLAFAVAAHLEPDVLVVDEVLAVGDAEFQKRSLGKMDEIGASGRTVIFVSHNMSTITRLCERAILLDGGRIVDDGPADRVVARYLSGELGLAAARLWDDPAVAPGNENVRLRAVRVVNRAGATTGTVDVREPLAIELEFDILSSGGTPFVPWIALYNDHGDHIFSAIDTDPAWRESRSRGSYKTIAWIPANFLNEGTLLVSVSLNTFAPERSIRQAHVDGALTFHVVDPGGGDTARGHYGGVWPGPVRPLLEWTTEHQPADAAAARASRA